jgi:hypothetical protein
MGLYATGHGQIEKADLFAGFDHPDLIDTEEPGRYVILSRWLTDPDTGLSVPYPGNAYVHDIDEIRLVRVLK